AATAEASQHPEFNRLSFQFRQGLQAGNVAAANHAFEKLTERKIDVGLSNKSLLQYVALLGQQKLWALAVRPLRIVGVRDGDEGQEALLRLAQVQLKVLKRPGEAAKTLSRVRISGEEPTEPEQIRIKKRDAILRQVREMETPTR
ncbi:MAG: rhomboid family intramembrane serine protease, partial [Planctomycetota bacterium]